MAKSPQLATLLKDLTPDELREVIAELCKLSPNNRQFVELFLSSTSDADIVPIIGAAKQKIRGCFYTRSNFPVEKIDFRGARKIISEHAKIIRDYPHYITDLKLYYVEIGTDMTLTYGDMYESFYDSLIAMMNSFAKDVMKHPSWYDPFRTRVLYLRSLSDNFGWGYGDYLEEITEELEKKLGGAGTQSLERLPE